MPDAGRYSVRDYGARGNGAADDTAAIQRCIDAALGDADPKTSFREARGPIYLPAGKYRITAPLRIWSAQHVKFHGDGTSTQLVPVGSLDSVLDLNGVAYSTFEDFMIRGDGRSEAVTDAINYYWDPPTARRSSMRNVFEKITIQDTRFVTGFRVGKQGAGVQTDQTAYRDLSIEGNVASRDETFWQTGFHVGDGVFANVLSHFGYNLEVCGCVAGIKVDATDFALYGGSLGYNDVDINGQTHGPLSINATRSKGSGRFFQSIGPSSNDSLYSFNEICWSADKMAADGQFIRLTTNGNVEITNLRVPNIQGGATAKIVSRSPISSTIQLRGAAVQSTVDQFLDLGPNTTAAVEGFSQYSDRQGQTDSTARMVIPTPTPTSDTLRARDLILTGSIDFGDGRKWTSEGLFVSQDRYWTPDGLYPGGFVKWPGAGGMGPGPNESFRFVGWTMDANGNRRQGIIVPPLRRGK